MSKVTKIILLNIALVFILGATPAALVHNRLDGLQGGTTSEYYHLTETNYNQIGNWNTAYGWGDHSSESYLKNVVEDTSPQLGGNLDGQDTYHLVDFVDGTFRGTITGGVIVASSIGSSLDPSEDDYYDIGSSTKEWRDIYISHTLYLGWKLSDGTNSLTVANAKDAYDHIHNLTTDIDHDQLTNFVADKHIDWTDASDDFKTVGTGEFLTNTALTPIHSSDFVVLSDTSNETSNPFGVSVQHATDMSIGSYFTAGAFNNTSAGTRTVLTTMYGLYGGCEPAIAIGGYAIYRFYGLRFDCINDEDVAGGDYWPNYQIFGMDITATLGQTGKTISGNLYPCMLYGALIKTNCLGTLNATKLGVADDIGDIYGTKIEMTDDFSVTDGDFRTYGLHITALDGIGDAGVGWGIYSTGATNNAIDGNLRIGSTTAPTDLLSITAATETFDVVDAGSAAATEQDWIEVKVGGNTGYIRVYAAK